jgi:uncharacterized protein YdeI (YjbR/CyaY-like superfamily)
MSPSKSALKNESWLPAVDLYIEKSAPFAQPILHHLREVIHQAVPGVTEEMKWSRPFFMCRGIILGNVAAFKQHCSLGLWGSEMADTLRADGVASKEAMGTFGRITSLNDLPAKAKLVDYLKKSAKLIDEGARTKSLVRQPRVAKPAPEMPAALQAALGKNKVAARNFEKLSLSCRREYIDWIAEAKRDETRDKRVASAVGWIAEGKSRNWKYEKRP